MDYMLCWRVVCTHTTHYDQLYTAWQKHLWTVNWIKKRTDVLCLSWLLKLTNKLYAFPRSALPAQQYTCCVGCSIVYHRDVFGVEGFESTVVYYCDIQWCGVYSLSVMPSCSQLGWHLIYSQVHLGKWLYHALKSKTSHWSNLKTKELYL